jgi:hypothetical protein
VLPEIILVHDPEESAGELDRRVIFRFSEKITLARKTCTANLYFLILSETRRAVAKQATISSH